MNELLDEMVAWCDVAPMDRFFTVTRTSLGWRTVIFFDRSTDGPEPFESVETLAQPGENVEAMLRRVVTTILPDLRSAA